MAENYKQYLDKYRSFVTNNPLLASEIEVALKWASYIVAGNILSLKIFLVFAFELNYVPRSCNFYDTAEIFQVDFLSLQLCRS